MFVAPMVAISRGDSGPDIISDSAKRTRTVRGITALLALAECAPGVVLYVVERLIWPGLDPYHGVRAWAGLMVAVLAGCYLAWFVLVKTEVAVQLLEQIPLVPRLPGEAETLTSCLSSTGEAWNARE